MAGASCALAAYTVPDFCDAHRIRFSGRVISRRKYRGESARVHKLLSPIIEMGAAI